MTAQIHAALKLNQKPLCSMPIFRRRNNVTDMTGAKNDFLDRRITQADLIHLEHS